MGNLFDDQGGGVTSGGGGLGEVGSVGVEYIRVAVDVLSLDD